MALGAIVALPALARADGPQAGFQIRWSAPKECPDDLALLRAVEGFLGQPLAHSPERALLVNVTVQGDSAHGYGARLSFQAPAGVMERAIEHPDCGKLTEGAGLLIALAIDPERVQARHQETVQQGAVSEVAPVPAPTSEPPRDTAPPSPPVAPKSRPGPDRPRAVGKQPRNVQTGLGLAGLVGAGMLPSAAPGVGAELGLRSRFFEAAVAGRYWLARDADVPSAPGKSVDVSLWTGGLRLCAVHDWSAWSAKACARADVGDMTGRGERVNNPRTRHAVFSAFGGGLGVAYAMGRLSPVAGLDLLRAVSRPRFGVLRDDQGVQAFRPQTWQLVGHVGLAYAL